MHSYESLFTHTHTHSSLGLYAHSYADVCLCVCVLVPSLCTLQCKTIKKHFVYCGIEALIRFALVHFASVWFVLFLSVSVWVSGYGFILAMPVILQPGQSRIVYYSTGTTQLPPLFVIELIPALRSPHSALQTANCTLWALLVATRWKFGCGSFIFNLVFTSSKLNQFSIAQLTTAIFSQLTRSEAKAVSQSVKYYIFAR